jgi:hypothetical protein
MPRLGCAYMTLAVASKHSDSAKIFIAISSPTGNVFSLCGPVVFPSFLACIIAFVPYKTFAKLQDEFFAVSKQMRNEKDPEEKMKLLKELQEILKESHRVLEEIHKKSNQK